MSKFGYQSLGFGGGGPPAVLTDDLAYPSGLTTLSNYTITAQPEGHWDASDLNGNGDANNGISDGDSLAAWNDRSGNGNHMAQATGGDQPSYDADGLLTDDEAFTKPAVYVDGTEWFEDSDFFSNADFSGERGTIIFVYRNNGGGNDTPVSTQSSASELMQGGASTLYQWLFTARSSATASAYDLEPGYGSGMYGVRVGASDIQNSMHHHEVDTHSVSSLAWSVGSGMYLGRGNHAAFHAKGWLGEVLVWNTVLSDADYLVVHQYLAKKYNMPLATRAAASTYTLGTISSTTYTTTRQPALHMDADDSSTVLASDKLTTPSDGAAVVWWKSRLHDQYFNQPTAASQPVYDTDAITSPATRAGVYFDGTNDFLEHGWQPGVWGGQIDGNFTLIYVFTPDSDTSGFGPVSWSGYGSGFGAKYNSTTSYDSTLRRASRLNAYTTPIANTGIQILSYVNDQSGNSWKMFHGGGTELTDAKIPTTADMSSKWANTYGKGPKIGNTLVQSEYLKGWVFEALLYDTALSATDHNAILDYYTAKWGATHSDVS